MPIDLKLFKDAQKPLDDRILAVLGGDTGVALSLQELIARVEGFARVADVMMMLLSEQMSGAPMRTQYEVALERLVKTGKLNRAVVQGNTYFALKEAT
jgi:hypothetical protein